MERNGTAWDFNFLSKIFKKTISYPHEKIKRTPSLGFTYFIYALSVGECVCTFGKHGQNIRAAPAPGVSALIKHRVKLDWILLPPWTETWVHVTVASAKYKQKRLRSILYTLTFSNGTDILIKPCDESNVARTRLGGNPCVRHSPGALLFNNASDIWGLHSDTISYSNIT